MDATMNVSTMQVSRMEDVDRNAITPDEGELVFTTDKKKLYVGDGNKQGGHNVGETCFITEDMTVNVALSGADYSNINDALGYLSAFRIKDGAVVTIAVAAGTYNMTEHIIISHLDSASIEIVGSVDANGNVDTILDFSGDTYGLYLSKSALKDFKDIKIQNAGSGVFLDCGSVLKTTGTVEVTDCSVGVKAIINSSVYFDKLILNNNNDGMSIGTRAYVCVNNVDIQDNARDGVHVASSGSVYIAAGTITGNTRYGVNAVEMSSFSVLPDVVVTGNLSCDLIAQQNSNGYAANMATGTVISPANHAVGNDNSYIF